MNRLGTIAVASLSGALAFSTHLAAQPRRALTIASGSVDGVYYPIAGAMSRITSDARDLNVRATVQSSAGSVENVQLIRSGEVDFALLQNDIAYYAFNGVELGALAGKPVKSMAGVFTVYPEPVHIVVTQASGVKSPRDLRGKRVALGPPGSGTEQNALQILGAHGIGEGDLRMSARISFAAAADQLKAGVVDAAFFTVALDAAVVADALSSGKVGLVGVGRTAGEALESKYPFYTMGKIPANTYKGQEREIETPVVMAMLVARTGLAEMLVYRFTKAIFDNLPQFHAAHAAARSLTLQTALVGMALPLHPGAERFFKERGIAR
ncbi:MAG TPA: TAXI family TRAP transporter solute-binding subunit [Candidatus Binatia bacterium]|nr:TAXI family TRAP transporter solute-binding subunit [Candidatus Binatia bacterium]